MRILAIGAHPDDLEIYAWGSLSAWAARGADLVLAIATDGAGGGVGPPAELVLRREEEARAAARMLAVEPRFLGFPDGGLSEAAGLVRALTLLVQEARADLLVTHAPNDYHADHRALSSAAGQAAGFSVPVLHMDTMGGTGFAPSHWVDVTPYWPAKCSAIRCHASQDPERFVTAMTRQAAFRAGEANAPGDARAEAFRFEPRHPFADVRDLLPPAPPVRPISSRRP
jgi:N-acetylglucosamine malate deacetylase 1